MNFSKNDFFFRKWWRKEQTINVNKAVIYARIFAKYDFRAVDRAE